MPVALLLSVSVIAKWSGEPVVLGGIPLNRPLLASVSHAGRLELVKR